MNRCQAPHAVLLATALLLLAAPAESGETEVRRRFRFLDTGPLRIREQFLLTQGFLAFDPESARVLQAGGAQLDVGGSVGNAWAMSDPVERALDERTSREPLTLGQLRAIAAKNPAHGIYFVDGEVHRASVVGRFGVGHGVEVSVGVSATDMEGGLADGIIEDFHEWIASPQSGRLGKPRDEYQVYLRTLDGHEVIRFEDPSAGIGDVVVGSKLRLVDSEAWDLALQGAVKVPIGDEEELLGSGSADVGAQLLWSRWFRRASLHGSLAATWLGEHEVLGTDEQLTWGATLSWEIGMGSRASFVLQAVALQSPLADHDLESLDEVVGLVDAGVKLAATDRILVFAAVSENVVSLGNTLDVALHVGLTATW